MARNPLQHVRDLVHQYVRQNGIREMRITSAQYPVDEDVDGCAGKLIRSRVRQRPGCPRIIVRVFEFDDDWHAACVVGTARLAFQDSQINADLAKHGRRLCHGIRQHPDRQRHAFIDENAHLAILVLGRTQ